MAFWDLYPEDWDKISLAIKKRDKYTCQDCKKKHPANSKHLHVHHIVSLSKGGTNNLSNLITLCYNCHKKYHAHMGKTKTTSGKRTFSKPFRMG